MNSRKKIGIMGGTFDPIHYGHLVTAEFVRSEFGIDFVLFIPSGNPPHKEEFGVTSSEHRYLMTMYATSSNPNFEVSRIEIDRPGKTYTIDTMKELRYIYGTDTEFYFITGADAISQIMEWKDIDELLTISNFVAVTRPGYNNDYLREKSEELNHKYGSSIRYFEIPALAISSSDIRARVMDDKTVRYLLPDEVNEHIRKNNLYKERPRVSVDDIKIFLRKTLSEYRYSHTMHVASAAGRLAEHYMGDPCKAYLAGLLHDMAKELPSARKLEMCREFGIEVDDYCRQQPDLLHGPLSAKLAKFKFSIDDPEILDAVSYHTTGRENMSLLTRILFVADLLDPGRGLKNPDINRERAALEEIAFRELDAAVIRCLEIKLEFTEGKKQVAHPASKLALDWYKKMEVGYGGNFNSRHGNS